MAMQHYPAHHYHDLLLLEEAFLADIGFGYHHHDQEAPPSSAAPSQASPVVTSPEEDASSGSGSGGTIASASGAGDDDSGHGGGRNGHRNHGDETGDKERRLRRRISNRESARRSRARKQRHLDEQRAAAALLRASKRELADRLRGATARNALVELANARLHAEGAALARRLGAALALAQLYASSSSAEPAAYPR